MLDYVWLDINSTVFEYGESDSCQKLLFVVPFVNVFSCNCVRRSFSTEPQNLCFLFLLFTFVFVSISNASNVQFNYNHIHNWIHIILTYKSKSFSIEPRKSLRLLFLLFTFVIALVLFRSPTYLMCNSITIIDITELISF